ncbi:hypothetical protein CPJCM30710_13930 [Clostridium polyendosporum]|uniref:Uncharacterized protein n=1 Tax=Clostridium polyendosporum TaxID=69208 RepID=A0A919VG13_9CLOT|nr:hypothetical protein [Clostridium polyendosporum]GIM28727.1 hypothetical protein CPJCM30710_13930 [Clostridium polyendosporum]
MKKYVKPTFEFVELRIEERVARCVNDPLPPSGNGDTNYFGYGNSSELPGNHPGCVYHCPQC